MEVTKILVVDDDQHIRELISMFLRKAGFEIHEACDGIEALAVLESVENLMSQVWVNLLHNSIKFTPNGGTISIHLRWCDQEAVVCIADTGVGIAEDDQ